MLSHIKVLDLTEGLGAYAGRLLAELGAHVTKLERPGGDPSREPVEPALRDASASWYVWNAGKEGAQHDVHSAAGKAAFLKYTDDVDILIRGRADMPLTHVELARRNPRLIDVVVAPFDQQSPRGNRPETDLTLMARSGLAAITGDPDRAPLRLPGEQAYALAGIQAAIGALTALHARHASGTGQLVGVSAFQAAVLANYREPLMWQWSARVGRRTGNLLVRGKSGVRQVWACRDGYVTWSFVDNPGMMRSLIRVMQQAGCETDLASVDWDATLVADVAQETIQRWEESVAAFFLRYTKVELAALSVANGFGLSRIDTLDDVLSSEQLRQRAMWRTLNDAARGTALGIPGPPFVSSERFEPDARPAPTLVDQSAPGGPQR